MTAMFGQYQSQSTKVLSQIDSTKYPDTNKDFEANVRRLNQFVDYLAQYVLQMQKGVDQANEDPISQIRDAFAGMATLLGGGDPLGIVDINLGDLQYYLPAIGALFGFDLNTPFPLNLVQAAESFFLGYIVPLDAFASTLNDFAQAWMTTLGLSPEFEQAVGDLITNIGRFVQDCAAVFTDATNLLGIFDIFSFTEGPIGTIWKDVTDLLSNFNIQNLGAIVDPFLETLTPWIELLAQIVGKVDDLIEAFDAGLGGSLGANNLGLPNISNWLSDFLGIFGLSNSSGLGSGNVILGAVDAIPVFGPLIDQFISSFGGTTGSGFLGTGGLGSIITDLLGTFGGITGLGTGSPTLNTNILADIPAFGPILNWLEGFASNIPVLDQLIGAVTGEDVSGTSLLDFGNLFGGLGSLATVFQGFAANIPILNQLVSASGGTLTGNPLSDFANLFVTIGTDFISLVESFIPGFGSSNPTQNQAQNTFNNVIGNFLSMFGLGGLFGGAPTSVLNQPTSSFDPIAMVENALSSIFAPAGALTTATPAPLHILGNITGIPTWVDEFIPTNWIGSFTNLLPNMGSLDNPAYFAGLDLWDVDTTVGRTSLGSATTIADGTIRQFTGVPITTAPTQTHFLGIFTKWSDLVTLPGTAIQLLGLAYGAAGNFISAIPISAIGNLPPSSIGFSDTDLVNTMDTVTADAEGWVLLSGTVQAPMNSKYIKFATQVTNLVTMGQSWFDDAIHAMQGMIDAGQVGNVATMAQLPFGGVEGVQGIEDIGNSVLHYLNSMLTGLTGIQQDNATYSQVSNALNNLATKVDQALTMAQSATSQVASQGFEVQTPGANNFAIPPEYQVVGTKFQLVGLGSGGAGDGEFGAPYESAAGTPGHWNGAEVTYGIEIPAGTTDLICNVAPTAPGAGSYFTNGASGSPTTWTLPDGTVLLSATGGVHGGDSSGTGKGPGNFNYPEGSINQYIGGSNVGANANGSVPGGGGSGAVPFSTTSGSGGHGYGAIVCGAA